MPISPPAPSSARSLTRATSEPSKTDDASPLSPFEKAVTLLGDRREALALDGVTRPHPLLLLLLRGSHGLLVAPARLWDRARDLLRPFAPRIADGTLSLLLVGRPAATDVERALEHGVSAIVREDADEGELHLHAVRAFDLMAAKERAESRGKWLNRYRYELGELINIARTITTERDPDKLLSVILEKSRFITGADAGSIYVVEHDEKNPLLRFKLTQNDSCVFDSREFTIPVNSRSIAGSVALSKQPINIADVYHLPAFAPYAFDRSFDERLGYRTVSMLVVPLISQRDEVIGVIQLINKKRHPERKLVSKEDFLGEIVPFDERSAELLGMLASQAGASLENATLYEDIKKLFDGFVIASVEAIESRDPTTSGHSRRVADLTVNLALVVDRESTGPYKDAFFSREDLRELEYASLLHDFGKIGVREKVLVKAKKLFDERLEIIRARFDFVERTIEADVLARKLRAMERGASPAELLGLDQELLARRAELEESYQAVLSANEPTVLSGGDFERIEKLARETYVDLRGDVKRLLEDSDVTSLVVKRGSLTPEEFDEIRSHVTHTFRFLSRIPWGKALRRVPLIAGAHHERLNGTGYPHRLRAEEIPVQSKMMSVADVFDALTASDRPYKKAVPIERALDILEFGVKDGHLDPDLVRLFQQARVWESMGDAAPTSRLLGNVVG